VYFCGNGSSVVGTATGLRAGRSDVLNIDRGKKFFSSPKRPDRLWSPLRLPFNGHRFSFPEAKRPGREINHSPLPSAEARDEWSYTSTSSMCLHGVERENFTFCVPVFHIFYFFECLSRYFKTYGKNSTKKYDTFSFLLK